MSIFTESASTQAYLKMGLMGFAGDGKTYTASSIAIGLVQLMRENELPNADAPVLFVDSETGSDYVQPRFAEAGIKLMVAKTRAFTDLIAAFDEVEAGGTVLIIDSISHFWTELMDTYQKKKRKRFIEFQDWAWLKSEWRRFTDRLVNSPCHTILCGRAGFEYDFFERDDGKRELTKTGVKMKAENETGYEPSMLVLMEKHRDLDTGKVWRTGSVLKDRTDTIDGMTFTDPTFENFLPHIKMLNLGGDQMGVDTDRKSDELFTDDGTPTWQHEKKQRTILCEEIKGELLKHFPSTSAADKKAKGDMLEQFFGTLSWTAVENMHSDELKPRLKELKQFLSHDPAESGDDDG